jgi:hypothetical protein
MLTSNANRSYFSFYRKGGTFLNLRSILALFIPPPLPHYDQEKRRLLMKKAVAKTASGNILLQFGRYILSSDITALKEKALRRKN